LPQKTIYTPQFLLLCLSAFLFFGSFNMIIPELPAYLTSLGGEDYKGLIIALFTLTAGLSRPFSGKLADTIGRRPVMFFGAIVCFVAGLLYPFVSSVTSFLALRFFHGFSTGFTPTGNAAYVADVVPFQKRGEAMGILGVAGSLGMSSGPAIGGFVASEYSVEFMFYLSSFVSIASVLIILGMQETLTRKVAFQWGMLKLKRSEIIEPNVIAPAVVLMLTIFSFGIILTIIPDLSVHLGFENKGLFFTVFTLSSLLIRFLAGKASDKYGRVTILKISSLLIAVAMILIAYAETKVLFFTAAVVFGVATGMNSPTLFAWAIDLAHTEKRGKALATIYIFLEIGIGVGAVLSGWVYSNKAEMFEMTFLMGAALAVLGFITLQLFVPKKYVR
jgi:MFS family permease